MTNTNETIADIIAEMRALSNPISDGIIAINGRSIADRLEAAWKREKAEAEADALAAGGIVEASRATAEKSLAVGDAVKLREALKLCVAEMCDRCRELAAARGNPLPCLSGCEPVRKAKFALAAPRRNCDVGTVGEQEARFFAFCKNHDCTANCPVKKKWNFEWGHNPSCGVLFSQMPYEEGGAK